ncbi:MAG: hypothetical protein M1600_00320 [Firmicutes bacterium]|jgi:hypothetical protein|nr:hypothetical protein [Bacillota bacterium]
MLQLHDEKPAISSGNSSLNLDLIFWNPSLHDPKALLLALSENHLGERSQTVAWLTKFTVRLTMWKGQYFPQLTPGDWQHALVDLEAAIRQIAAIYHPRRIEYDTRAFTVGLVKSVRKHTHPLSILSSGTMDRATPVWSQLKP